MNSKTLYLICSLMILMTLPIAVFAESENNIRNVEDIRVHTDLPLNESEIQKMVDETPSTNPAMFEEMAKAQDTVAAYGEVPSINGEEAYDWGLSLQRIARSIQDNDALKKYEVINDGLITYGRGNDGFFIVYLNVERKDQITLEDIENIKNTFEEYAEKEGIYNLPIIFSYSKLEIELHAAGIPFKESSGMFFFLKQSYMNIFERFANFF
jgi:hypothetical protein